MKNCTPAKRVAIFLPSMAGGGTERVSLIVASGLLERGFEIDIVLARAQGPLLGGIPRRARVVDLNVARTAASVPRLVRYIDRERPQALLPAMIHSNVVALFASRLAHRKVDVYPREVWPTSVVAADGSRKNAIMMSMARKLYPHASCILAVSEGIADDLAATLKIDRQRIAVINNPVLRAELFTQSAAPAAHPWLAAGAPPVVVTVGRLASEKGQDTLIRAFSNVCRTFDCRLLILGEGEHRRKLETLIRQLGLEQKVALPGFVENPYASVARAAVFVLPSIFEGLPNALIEAMALKVPVVATDCLAGPREILDCGRFGRLVPVGDVAGMSAAILDVLFGRQTFANAEDHLKRYSAEECVSRYEAYLTH